MKTPSRKRAHPLDLDGTQLLYFYPNGYGASVIQFQHSYGADRGLWELAVLVGTLKKYSLTYSTPITDDVIGSLTENEVDAYLTQIEELLDLDANDMRVTIG